VFENTIYSFTPSANDSDGDTLTFSITNQPGWATFNSATGTLQGTPSSADIGTYGNIIISVSDGTDSASLTEFSIAVLAQPVTNSEPVISGTPTTSVYDNTAYSFTPTASDSDGDTLTFSITNRPAWAAFNTVTGTLSGTPSTTDIGTYSNIVISVSDGTASTSLNAFSISVVSQPVTNSAPVISGTPTTSVYENTAYSFTPTASDSDGDPLTFSITNRPSWASFDAATGSLTGTPSSSDIGTYNDIVISVSDGTASASLSAFNITVDAQPAPSTGSATINWTPPTEYTDNSPLTNLSGYKIYYGTSSGNYTDQLTINNPGLTAYTIDNLPGNNTTYYFVMTAVDSAGRESNYSNVISRTIQ
jgi:hypothetical protein